MSDDGSTSASSSSVNVESATRCGRRAHEIDERGGRRAAPILFGRPAERGEQAGRIENVAPRPLGPFAFDQPDDHRLVEIAVPRRLGVEELESGIA